MNADHYQLLTRTEHWALVYKPALWLSVPSSKGVAETRLILGLELQRDLGQQVFPVHRLDLEVSGLMIFALTQVAQRFFNRAFEQHWVEKTYLALTSLANLPPAISLHTSFKIQSLLCMGKKRAFVAPHGKNSITIAQCSPIGDQYLKWTLNPLTGRRHQLRAHLAQQGTPILNDTLYGGPAIEQAKGIALLAFSLNFKKLFEQGLDRDNILPTAHRVLSLEQSDPVPLFLNQFLRSNR